MLVAGEVDIPYRSGKEIAGDWLQDIGLVFKPMKHESTLLDLQFIQRVYLLAAVYPGIIFKVTCRGGKGRDRSENIGFAFSIL